MSRWQVQAPTVLLAGGIVFSFIALRSVVSERPPVVPPSRRARSNRVSASGTSVRHRRHRVLISTASSVSRLLVVIGAVLAVITIDLFAMLFAPTIVAFARPGLMRIFSAVLAIMTVALALQIDLLALRRLSIVPQ